MKRFLRILIKSLGYITLAALIIFGGLHLTSRILIQRLTAQAQDSPLFQNVDYVLVDNDSVAYRVFNPGEEKTLVMIHGFLGSSYEYYDFFKALVVDQDFTVIAFDTMGFGLSDKPLDYTYTSENHAKTLLAAIDTLGLENYTLMGHSMGGGIAMRMALIDPDAMENLVLIAPVGPDTVEATGAAPPLWFYDLLFKNYFAQRLGVNTATVEPISNDIFSGFIIQNAAIPSPVLQKFTIDQDTRSITENLGNLMIRTLIVYGAEDRWTPPTLMDVYLQKLPQAEGVILENSGHLPYLEQPEALRQLIENFINTD